MASGKIFVLVEGRTEEMFIKNVLVDHFRTKHGSTIIPIVLTTKPVMNGSNYKGGILPYGKVNSEIRRLLGDTSATVVTTMFDLYGLPKDFPGANQNEGISPGALRKTYDAWKNDIYDSRFVPYFSIHEYESLVIGFPEMLAETVARTKLPRECKEWGNCSPETLNHGNHPSKRIAAVFNEYNKTLHGSTIIQKGKRRLKTVLTRC